MEEGFGFDLNYAAWVGQNLANKYWKGNSHQQVRAKYFQMRVQQWGEIIHSLRNNEKLIYALGLDPKDIPPAERESPTIQTLMLLMAGYRRYQQNWRPRFGSSSSSTWERGADHRM